MKKTIKTILFTVILSLNTTAIYAKVPDVKGVSVPTVYGIHDPVDANLGGIEWIYLLALFTFLTGLILIVNGKALKSQSNK